MSLGMDMKKFEKGFRNAERTMKKKSRKMQKSLNKMKNKMGSIGSTMSMAITGPAIAGFTALTKGTENFRETLAPLKTNAEQAGIGIDVMNRSMAQMQGVTGELDSNVEGLSNLFASGLKGDQLQKTLNNLAGAAIKFKDTIKFEEVSNSFQETLSSGKGVGQFVELLERSGVSLKTWEKGLRKAKTQGRQYDYVLQTLSKTGLSQVYQQHKKNNQEIFRSRKANYQLQQQMARLGNKLAPVLTKLTSGLADLLEKFNNLSTTSQKTIGIIAAVAAAIGPLFSAISSVIGGISALSGAMSTVMGWLGLAGGSGGAIASMVTPIGWVVAAVAGLVAVWKNFLGIRDALMTMFDGIVTMVKLQAKAIWNYMEMLHDLVTFDFSGMKKNAGQMIDNLKGLGTNAFDTGKQLGKDFHNGWQSTFGDEQNTPDQSKKFQPQEISWKPQSNINNQTKPTNNASQNQTVDMSNNTTQSALQTQQKIKKGFAGFIQSIRQNSKKATQNLKTMWHSVGNTISSSFSNNLRQVINGTKTVAEGFKGIWTSVIDSVKQKLIEFAASKAFETVLNMMTGGVGGSLLGGIGKFFAGIFHDSGVVGGTGQEEKLALVQAGEYIMQPEHLQGLLNRASVAGMQKNVANNNDNRVVVQVAEGAVQTNNNNSSQATDDLVEKIIREFRVRGIATGRQV
jgi:hypothetical protein